MTSYVIARVASVDGQLSTGNYTVGLDCWVTDGTTSNQINGNSFQVPFSDGIVKANRSLRVLLASYLASAWSITIDPDDIYFPFS